MRGDMLVEEPLTEFLHGRGGAQAVALRAGIAAQPDIGQVLHGLGAGLIRGDRAVRADIDPADAPARAELGEVDFPARGVDPETEASKFVIPEEILLAGSGSGFYGTFRDLDHALASSGRNHWNQIGIIWVGNLAIPVRKKCTMARVKNKENCHLS